MSGLDFLKWMFSLRAPLLKEHSELPRSGWVIWTHFNPGDSINAREGDSILEYKGTQLAHLPFSMNSERVLRSVVVWLEQWRKQIDYAHRWGSLLILTSALLSLAKQTFPAELRELVIETEKGMG